MRQIVVGLLLVLAAPVALARMLWDLSGALKDWATDALLKDAA
jgi:hypothetical protein